MFTSKHSESPESSLSDGSDCDNNWSPQKEMVEHGNENEDLKANTNN